MSGLFFLREYVLVLPPSESPLVSIPPPTSAHCLLVPPLRGRQMLSLGVFVLLCWAINLLGNVPMHRSLHSWSQCTVTLLVFRSLAFWMYRLLFQSIAGLKKDTGMWCLYRLLLQESVQPAAAVQSFSNIPACFKLVLPPFLPSLQTHFFLLCWICQSPPGLNQIQPRWLPAALETLHRWAMQSGQRWLLHFCINSFSVYPVHTAEG